MGGLDLVHAARKVVALLGPNGGGKTTGAAATYSATMGATSASEVPSQPYSCA